MKFYEPTDPRAITHKNLTADLAMKFTILDTRLPCVDCALKNVNVSKALEEAVSAIYFADSSDYLSYLWTIVSLLGGEEAVERLNKNASAAWHHYDDLADQAKELAAKIAN